MRCNQVSIFIERFGKYVPKKYPGDVQVISVYVDDFQSVYAALSKAYALAVNELSEYEQIGVRADVSTNEFSKSDYREMHGTIPKRKRSYEDDVNFQYGDTEYELCKDYVWLYEHSSEIIDLIKGSQNAADMVIALKDNYELSDYQIRKLSQIRLDMLTQEEYERCEARIKEIDDWREKQKSVDIKTYHAERYEQYERAQIAKIKRRQEELEAYFKAAENYSEIIKLMEENEDFHDFAKIMQEKFGFTGNQCKYFTHMSIQDFSKKERQKKQAERERLLEDLRLYEK